MSEIEINTAQPQAAPAPTPIIMPSPPAAAKEDEVPGQWQSRHAMWAGTILLLICIILAGFDVKKFYDLWINGWWGILAACGFIIGVKPSKDVMMAMVNRPKVVTS